MTSVSVMLNPYIVLSFSSGKLVWHQKRVHGFVCEKSYYNNTRVLFTSDYGGGICFRLRTHVCLSVCLCARLLYVFDCAPTFVCLSVCVQDYSMFSTAHPRSFVYLSVCKITLCFRLRTHVCLSVCLCARLLKTRAWIWMQCCMLTDVWTWMN